MTRQFSECAGMAYRITCRLRRQKVVGSISSAICFLHPVSTSQIGTDVQVLEYLSAFQTPFQRNFTRISSDSRAIHTVPLGGKNYVHYNS
jgi:hypothetical protein